MFGFLEMKQGGGQSSLTFGGDGTTHTVWEVILDLNVILSILQLSYYIETLFPFFSDLHIRML